MLTRWVLTVLQKNGKKLNQPTMQLFLKRPGIPWETLTGELEKLICYVGDRRSSRWTMCGGDLHRPDGKPDFRHDPYDGGEAAAEALELVLGSAGIGKWTLHVIPGFLLVRQPEHPAAGGSTTARQQGWSRTRSLTGGGSAA